MKKSKIPSRETIVSYVNLVYWMRSFSFKSGVTVEQVATATIADDMAKLGLSRTPNSIKKRFRYMESRGWVYAIRESGQPTYWRLNEAVTPNLVQKDYENQLREAKQLYVIERQKYTNNYDITHLPSGRTITTAGPGRSTERELRIMLTALNNSY